MGARDRLPDETPGAVIISRMRPRSRLDLVREFFPGWDLVPPFSTLVGHRWKRIVMLWAPELETPERRPRSLEWIEQLECRLVDPEASLEWLV